MTWFLSFSSIVSRILDLVEGLKNHNISKVCCGSAHSIAINEWGNVFAWGSNAFYQLGHNNSEAEEPNPKLVKSLGTKHIVQIACGEFHNILLTNGRSNRIKHD